jgi:hypothetical protein
MHVKVYKRTCLIIGPIKRHYVGLCPLCAVHLTYTTLSSRLFAARCHYTDRFLFHVFYSTRYN